jgi:uncharacterized protein (TIGR02246 family)
MIRLALCALFIAALAGCRESTKVDVAAIAANLKQKEVEWNRAYAARNAEAAASTYADDATLAQPGAPLATGIEAIRKETQSLNSDPNFRLQFASDRVEVAASGELAYSRGHYTLTMTDKNTNKASTSRGNYLTVWRRQAGTWKAVEDFVTPVVLATH